jgi:hypothetical protein
LAGPKALTWGSQRQPGATNSGSSGNDTGNGTNGADSAIFRLSRLSQLGEGKFVEHRLGLNLVVDQLGLDLLVAHDRNYA